MLYHTEVGIPKNVQRKMNRVGTVELMYGAHAKRAASDDGIKLPRVVGLSSLRPFEVEATRAGKILKIAYRMNYDKQFDLILVMNFDNHFVRTCWLNAVDDVHVNLDRSKYAEVQS